MRQPGLGQRDCWRRSNLELDRCEDNLDFTTYAAAAPTPALSPELVDALDNYSIALYGASGALASDSFRILWPELLPVAVRNTLAVRCSDVPPWQYQSETVMFVSGIAYRDLYQQAAIWVHRPLRTVPMASINVSDHAWVEGAHCGYALESVSSTTPMWFLSAPGSGVHINVGRSKRFGSPPIDMRFDGDHWTVHEGYYWRTEREVQIHISLMRGDMERASRYAGEDLSLYDSVQFPLYAPDQGNWMGETFTEVVMLRMMAEPDFLPDYIARHRDDPQVTDYLRCGPPNALRACRVDDPAVVQMSEQKCSRGHVEAVASVAAQSGCIYQPGGEFVPPGQWESRPGGR